MGKKVMVFDVETTGIPNFKLASDDPSQPYICEFAAALYDDEKSEIIRTINSLICPDGWDIQPDAVEVHGITTKMCFDVGRPITGIVQMALDMMREADVIAGYNVAFDLKMVRGACRRYDIDYDYDEMQAKKFDVMRKCTKLCKLPPTPKMRARGMKAPKTPTLEEAATILLKQPMPEAHRAFADMQTTMDLYRHVTAEDAHPTPKEDVDDDAVI